MNSTFIIAEYLLVFILLIFAFKQSLGIETSPAKYNVLISQDTSQMLKAVCCIIIVLHHFALRRQDITALKPISIGGGNFALPIFFILSAYGITKSELHKPINKFASFLKRRMLKLLKPLWIINFITIIVYLLIGANGYSPEVLKQARVNPLFCEIGSHILPVWEYLLLLVGIHEIDGVVWFVEVTLYSYLAFYISKSVFPICGKRMAFVSLYTVFIILFGIMAFKMELPAHYYRNLWSLIVGLILADYEKDFIHRIKLQYMLLCIIVIFLVIQCVLLHEYIYFPPAITAVVVIWGCGRFMKNRRILPASPIFKLAIMSYVVYLIHVKILNIEWHYIGFVSVLIPLIMILAIAYIYEFAHFKMIGKRLKTS